MRLRPGPFPMAAEGYGCLDKLREEAHERLQKATAKRLEAIEEEDAARYEFADALSQTQRQEKRAMAIDRELRELRGEG